MDSKGVSGVITAVLLILLAIAAIGILWVVIAVFVSDSGSEIGGGINSVGLSVDESYIEGENFYVKVRRDNAKGNLLGVRIIVEDSGGSSSYDDLSVDLREGEAKVVTINQGELLDIDFNNIISISVLPVIGENKVGNFGDSYVLADEGSFVSEKGLVAYWPFDGNAEDVVGDNDMICDELVCPMIVNNDYDKLDLGSAYEFDGDDWIRNDNPTNLPLGNSPRTMVAWIKPQAYGGGNYNGIVAYGMGCPGHGSLLSIKDNGQLSQAFWCEGMAQTVGTGAILDDWSYAIFTYDGVLGKLYLDGNLVATTDFSTSEINTEIGLLRIGTTDKPGSRFFTGSIDEVRIYDHALNAEEVAYLYRYN